MIKISNSTNGPVKKGDQVLYANTVYDVIRVDQHNRPIVIIEGEESQLACWDKVIK